MVELRHRGRPNERPLDVPEDAVDAWAEHGYVPTEEKKATTKKTTGRQSAKSNKK